MILILVLIDVWFASEPFAVSPSGKNVRGAVYRCWQTWRAVIVPRWTGESQQLFVLHGATAAKTAVSGNGLRRRTVTVTNPRAATRRAFS